MAAFFCFASQTIARLYRVYIRYFPGFSQRQFFVLLFSHQPLDCVSFCPLNNEDPPSLCRVGPLLSMFITIFRRSHLHYGCLRIIQTHATLIPRYFVVVVKHLHSG